MGKTTKRVLSLVLSVLMVLSMVSVFVIPVSAAETDDYGTAPAAGVYVINNEWTAEGLAALGEGDTVTYTYIGQEVTETYDPARHFATYADAYKVAYSSDEVMETDPTDAAITTNVTADNYFTYNPTFYFGPGAHAGIIYLRTGATILGNNAGISPNAALGEDDWSLAAVQENGGWKANTRNEETTFSDYIRYSTRCNNSAGVYEGYAAYWGYVKEKAYANDPDGVTNIVVDGIDMACSNVLLAMTGHDWSSGKTITYDGDTVTMQQKKKVNIHVKNAISTSSTQFAHGWNTTHDDYSITFSDFRHVGANAAMFQRYIDDITFERAFITGLTSSNAATMYATYDDAARDTSEFNLTVKDSILYDNATSASGVGCGFFYINMNNSKYNTFNLNVKDNILYDTGDGNWGIFSFQNTTATGKTLNADITGNLITHEKTNGLFNGNNTYITTGKTKINFRQNRVVANLSFIPPNASYSVADANTLLEYNFDDNFFAKTRDFTAATTTVGTDYVSAAIVPTGSVEDSTWGWDWTDPNYYYDYAMTLDSHGTKVASVDMQENGTAAIADDTIIIEAPTGTGTLTADSFVTNNDAATVEISTTSDFAETVESIDLSAVEGASTYYVKSYYDVETYKEASTKTYTVTIFETTPVDFNADLADGGVELYGKNFTADNTAIYPGDDVLIAETADSSVYYEWLDGTFYKFTVDNVNVFSFKTSTHSYTPALNGSEKTATGVDIRDAQAVAENGNLIIVGDITSDFIVTYPTTIYGANAGIDPVDKTNANVENNYECAINSAWGAVDETRIDKIIVMNDIAGTLKLDGITLTDTLYDNYRGGTSADVCEIVLENIVVDITTNSTTRSIIEGRNYRNQNSTDATLGASLNDVMTLRNFYIKAAKTNQIIDEWAAQTLTFDNVYCDSTAAGRTRDVIGFFKGGALNMNFNATITNCIFTNGVNLYEGLVRYDGNAQTDINFTEGDGYNYKLTVTNNIFYKVSQKAQVGITTGTLNELTVTNNLFVAHDGHTASATGFALIANSVGGADVVLAGNTTVNNNRFVGFVGLTTDLGMGENNPVLENSFVTSNYSALTDTDAFYGEYNDSIGNSTWYLDYDMTAVASDYYVSSMTSDNASISDFVIDNNNAKISFKLYDNTTTDEVNITLANENATYYWSTDAAGAEKIDAVASGDFTSPIETYYLNVELNEKVRTYTVDIMAYDSLVFMEDYDFESAPFDSTAVLITDKAANVATGETIYVSWRGTYYEFTVGVNAVAAVADTTAETLLIADWDKNVDFSVTRAMTVYTQNYDVNPVKNDGLGNNSPSHGEDWGYNTAYDTYKVSVKDIRIGDITGSVKLYGLNITGKVHDYSRTEGNNLELKFYNVSFTGDNLTGTGSNTPYLFFTTVADGYNLTQYEQTDSLYVENMYVQIDPSKAVRLIGEMAPATTEFNGMYVDAQASAFNEYNAFIKHSATNSEFIIRNSCLLNMSNADNAVGLQFQGKINDGDRSGGAAKDLPEGHTNVITLDNNIITGGLGGRQGTHALLLVYINGYSGVNITNNYLANKDTERSASVFWESFALTDDNKANYNCDVNVTSNVFNGYVSNLTLQYGSKSIACPNFKYTLTDNYVNPVYYEDLTSADAIGVPYTFNSVDLVKNGVGQYDQGNFLDYSFRLNAAGTLSTAEIYEMTYAESTTGDENVLTTTAETAQYTSAYAEETGYTYTFNFADLVTENKYHNVLAVTYGDASYDIDDTITVTSETPITDWNFGYTVTSPDGKSATETYSLGVAVHIGQKVEAKAATCTEAGHKEYYDCTTCDVYFADEACTQEIADLTAWLAEGGDGYVAALGHDEVAHDAQAATCTEGGWNAYVTCSRCDYTTYEEVAALGHDEVAHDAQAATCTEGGWNAYVTCSRCDYTTYEEVAALGHNAVKVDGKAAGYTFAGWNDYWYCGACDGYFADEACESAIADIEAWKVGDGKIDMLALPEIVKTSDTVATLNADGAVRRVYWGYIGTENTEYKWFNDFKALCGDTFTADYVPADGVVYELTTTGYYRFVVNYVDDNGAQADLVYTIAVEGEPATPAVKPVITASGNNAVLSLEGAEVAKIYYGYIGTEKTAYTGFDKTIFTEADFNPNDGDAYLMTEAGYYRFVVNYKSGDRYVDAVYTVYCEATAAENAGVPVFTTDSNVITLDYNDCTKVNKIYVGYVGEEVVEIDNWTDYKAATTSRYCVQTPADGAEYTLKNDGCYVILVNYFDGSRNVDAYYTFETADGAIVK